MVLKGELLVVSGRVGTRSDNYRIPDGFPIGRPFTALRMGSPSVDRYGITGGVPIGRPLRYYGWDPHRSTATVLRAGSHRSTATVLRVGSPSVDRYGITGGIPIGRPLRYYGRVPIGRPLRYYGWGPIWFDYYGITGGIPVGRPLRHYGWDPHRSTATVLRVGSHMVRLPRYFGIDTQMV